MSDQGLWTVIPAERAALIDVLEDLPAEDWDSPTLCTAWTVQDVVGHLTAAARTATLPWLVNMAVSRFGTDRHNQRLLVKHRGATPAQTLDRFRAAATSTIAPLGAMEGALGEIVTHSQDIARPLGLALTPSRGAVESVAEFFVRSDFAVTSSTLVAGLRLEATDGGSRAGEGPEVAGTTLDLVMALAGRTSALDELSGDGVPLLRERLARA